MTVATVTRETLRPIGARAGAARWTMVAVVALAAAAAGLGAGALAAGSKPVLALLLPLVLTPVLLWRWPVSGVLLMMGAAVTIEQFSYTVGSRSGTFTSRIPFFHTVSQGSGFTPMEILLLLAVVMWAMRTVAQGRPLLHGTPLGRSLVLLGGAVVLFLGIGLARHGAFKPAVAEVKPFVYVVVLYLLASSLMSSTDRVRRLWWVIVVGSGVKAAYGLVIFLSVRHVSPRPDAVLGHEESFFFGLFVMVTIGLWTFGVKGRLRVVATALLPMVLMADMVNSRRTAWAILFAASFTMVVISYARFPARRKVLFRCMAAIALLLAVYLPLFWNHTGSTAQPARAVRSVVAPSASDARDSSSDKYRAIEDANLALNIRAHHGTGNGFGVPINYTIAIPDLTGIASMLRFVPHDGVYWVWMRMGILGEGLFWLVIAEGVLACCRLVRAADPESAMLGAVVAAALLAYVVMGQKDLGFYWFRMAVAIGVLLGCVDAGLRRMQTTRQREEAACPTS